MAARQLFTLDVANIVPNAFNPNRMSDAEFREYVNEVRRLGWLPKPIIVRRLGDSYEIVDGEHGWRAAQEVGLDRVDAEVIEADDFEVMHQCYKRNRGGDDHPVLLGRMFRAMAEACGSARSLAKRVDVPDTTIGQYLAYARAADLRSAYGEEDRTDEVAQLSRRQLRYYLRLPKWMRDFWLDDGADLSVFDRYVTGNLKSDVTGPLERAELSVVFESSERPFVETLNYALELARWREDHGAIEGKNSYIRPVAELGLPVKVLDELPCNRDGWRMNVVISVDAWAALLQEAASRASGQSGLIPKVQAAVRIAIRDAGIDPADVLDLEDVELMQIVGDAADYIRAADYLTLAEQAWLHSAKPEASDEIVETAKRTTCEFLRKQRTETAGDDGRPRLSSVDVVFYQCLRDLQQEGRNAEDRQLLSDRSQWRKCVLECLSGFAAVRETQIGGRPAPEVIRDRLERLAWAELILVGAPLIGISPENAAEHWLEAINAEE